MKKFKTAAILAGGKSSRMGFDKQLIIINEKRIVENIINKLREEFDDILIVTNNPEYYIDFKVNVISDEIKNQGPLSGIHIGLKKSQSRYVYFIACDMPNVNIEYIRYMKSKMGDNIYACLTRQGNMIEPFNSFYSKELIRPIEYNLKNKIRSIRSLLINKKCIYISENEAKIFSPNWNMFLNINNKGDLKRYVKRIES